MYIDIVRETWIWCSLRYIWIGFIKCVIFILGTFIDSFYSSIAKILSWWKNQYFVQNQLLISLLWNKISTFTSIWTNYLKDQPRLSHSCKYYRRFFSKATSLSLYIFWISIADRTNNLYVSKFSFQPVGHHRSFLLVLYPVWSMSS